MCYKCLPYNKTEKRLLSKPEIQWKCPCLKSQHINRCANGGDQDAQAQLPVARLASIESKLDQTMQMLAASVQQLNSKLELKADKSEVDKIQTQLTTVQSELNLLKRNQEIPVNASIGPCVNEIMDREERKTNAVIFNIQESDSADADIRRNEDVNLVNAMLAQIETPTVTITDCRRLGKYRREVVTAKPRPIRISAATVGQRDAILQCAPKLKNFDNTKGVVIRKDLTPMQREEENNLRKEWQKKKEESIQQGDMNAQWVRRRGKVINIGMYISEALRQHNSDPRQNSDENLSLSGVQKKEREVGEKSQDNKNTQQTPPNLASNEDFPQISARA